jgi:hypothetical protein
MAGITGYGATAISRVVAGYVRFQAVAKSAYTADIGAKPPFGHWLANVHDGSGLSLQFSLAEGPLRSESGRLNFTAAITAEVTGGLVDPLSRL